MDRRQDPNRTAKSYPSRQPATAESSTAAAARQRPGNGARRSDRTRSEFTNMPNLDGVENRSRGTYDDYDASQESDLRSPRHRQIHDLQRTAGVVQAMFDITQSSPDTKEFYSGLATRLLEAPNEFAPPEAVLQAHARVGIFGTAVIAPPQTHFPYLNDGSDLQELPIGELPDEFPIDMFGYGNAMYDFAGNLVGGYVEGSGGFYVQGYDEAGHNQPQGGADAASGPETGRIQTGGSSNPPGPSSSQSLRR